MTLKEFILISTAYADKEEDSFEKLAYVLSAIINFGGMGSADPVSHQDIFKLRKYEEDKLKIIESWEDVNELLEEM